MQTRPRSFVLSAAVLAVACVAAPAMAQHEHSADKPKAAGSASIANRYYCPMHCEGAKVYDKPGTCPVCKMNLKQQTSDLYSVAVREVSGTCGGGISAGKVASLTFNVKNPTGLKITKFETVHEKPLHLLIVSKDLSWFRHEHPAMQKDGTFALQFTFPYAGEYTLYHDFTPTPESGAKEGPGQQVVPVAVTVDGCARRARAGKTRRGRVDPQSHRWVHRRDVDGRGCQGQRGRGGEGWPIRDAHVHHQQGWQAGDDADAVPWRDGAPGRVERGRQRFCP